MVVIVIDISKMNIDANAVRGSEPAVRQVLETLLDMTNGCVCCIQRDDLLKEVRAGRGPAFRCIGDRIQRDLRATAGGRDVKL